MSFKAGLESRDQRSFYRIDVGPHLPGLSRVEGVCAPEKDDVGPHLACVPDRDWAESGLLQMDGSRSERYGHKVRPYTYTRGF